MNIYYGCTSNQVFCDERVKKLKERTQKTLTETSEYIGMCKYFSLSIFRIWWGKLRTTRNTGVTIKKQGADGGRWLPLLGPMAPWWQENPWLPYHFEQWLDGTDQSSRVTEPTSISINIINIKVTYWSIPTYVSSVSYINETSTFDVWWQSAVGWKKNKEIWYNRDKLVNQQLKLTDTR